MRIGVQTFFHGQEQDGLAEYVAGVGRILEERRFGGVWMSEHVVSFPRYDPAYPYPYSDDGAPPDILSQIGMLDPMTSLTALACHTNSLRLATGIAILPQRNPVYFAKMGTGIDLLSNGRFIAGIGLGWSAQEYAATGTAFEHRGARADDYIQVVRSLWTDEVSRYQGAYFNLPPCIQLPKPARTPHPPFYFGGESKAALRRVARFGQGWVGFRLLPEQLPSRLAALQAMLEEHERNSGEVEVVVSPGEHRCNADTLARYRDLGVAEVVVVCLGQTLAEFERNADAIAEALVIPAQAL